MLKIRLNVIVKANIVLFFVSAMPFYYFLPAEEIKKVFNKLCVPQSLYLHLIYLTLQRF